MLKRLGLCAVFTVIIALYLSIGASADLASELASKGSVTITFGPKDAVNPTKGLVSDGSLYSKDIGFGWSTDLRAQTRDRGNGHIGLALLDRNVSCADFVVDLPDGDYLFEVTASDVGFAGGLAVKLDGEYAADPLTYRSGGSASLIVPVTSRSGQARITLVGGQDGVPNSVLASLKITPASADPDAWRSVKTATDEYIAKSREHATAREAKRIRQLAAYRPVKLADKRAPRQTFDLTGKWLFKPTNEMTQSVTGSDLRISERSWHVMDVPQFWQPVEWWIYTNGSATSHNFNRKEIERCKDLTFNYGTTKSGWYRQWIEVPKSFQGHRFVLHFDAVAAVAEVYWNGKRVSSHAGMFGPFECEVTPNIHFGERNLLAVLVSAGKVEQKDGKSQVAVTVNVTPEMLNSLPHGCFRAGLGGIWQPVRLEVTGHSRISDVIFRPRLDGAIIRTRISTKSKIPLSVKYLIIDAGTGRTLYRDVCGHAITGKGNVQFDIKGLHPKLWSPDHPNLYILKTRLMAGDAVQDEVSTTVGFKTFEARGNRLYLNGKPYFLRGADMPPHGLAPNNKTLAAKFMKMMHDGNTMATRFHVCPPSQTWLDAADKYGVGASVGENWPWVLMGDTPMPDKKLLQVWKNEFMEIVRANRNHPSIFMWTISNESYFEGDVDKTRRVEKYGVFSDMIKGVRAEAPGIPIVFHSGHVRVANEEPMLKVNGFDDGDVDDQHFYYGWYDRSPFQIDVAKDIEHRTSMGKRPFISQEASTGYPDNDTGHPTESYLRDHIVPQVWVGDDASYSVRPDRFLDIHAQITKEYAEKIRRDRTFLSGWMLFANCCWFKDVYDADRIAPYPTYWAVKKAWQPVLVSLASPNRHYRAGECFTSDVYVMNDDPDRPKLTDLTLTWHIYSQSNDGTSGSVRLPDCSYDGKCKASVTFDVPAKLPVDRANVTLELVLKQGDKVISINDYPLICATPSWYTSTDHKPLVVVEDGLSMSNYLKSIGFDCHTVKSVDWNSLDTKTCVVVGPGAVPDKDVAAFIERGGRVLMLEPDLAGENNPISAIAGGVRSVDTTGDFVDILRPELQQGMDPMDMHWWNTGAGDMVRVCRVAYQFGDDSAVEKLAKHIQPHGYLKKPEDIIGRTSYPVFEVRRGQGMLIVSSLLLSDDPVARRSLVNLVEYLGK